MKLDLLSQSKNQALMSQTSKGKKNTQHRQNTNSTQNGESTTKP